MTVTNNSTATVTLRVSMVSSYDWYEGTVPMSRHHRVPGCTFGARQSTSAQLGVGRDKQRAISDRLPDEPERHIVCGREC